jgi:hypothetical protein
MATDATRNIGALRDKILEANAYSWRVFYTGEYNSGFFFVFPPASHSLLTYDVNNPSETHDLANGDATQKQRRLPVLFAPADVTGYQAQKLSMLAVFTLLVSPGTPMLFYGQVSKEQKEK